MPALVAENTRLQRAYARLARVYDAVFGAALQPGRAAAVGSITGRPGLRVLEVGIGTALTAECYSPDWKVVGIDLSLPMLSRARARIGALERGDAIALVLGDAAQLPFAANSFDVVIAPYVMSVVPDPLAVGCELRRVCTAAGRIVMVNHFLSDDPIAARLEKLVSPIASRIGFRTDLALTPIVKAAGLRVTAVEKVNRPPIWTLVTCAKRMRAVERVT
jgi:phosphatidylethanolamine/phosphatidyl-N-methylethanolamine N-methyltransferase